MAELDGIEALSFDLFDTLVDGRLERLPRVEWGGRSVPSTADALHAHVAARHPVAREDFLDALRETDRALRARYYDQGLELPTPVRFAALVERLGLEDGALAEELTALHMGFIRELSELPPHHLPLLERLRRSRPIALCSNFSHTGTALRIVRELGLADHLDVVVISEEVGVRKPRPEIFERVVAGLGVEPGRVLHVGDRLRADVSGAAAAGMRTAWVTRRVPDREAALAAHDGPPPDLEIADLGELEERLAGSPARGAERTQLSR